MSDTSLMPIKLNNINLPVALPHDQRPVLHDIDGYLTELEKHLKTVQGHWKNSMSPYIPINHPISGSMYGAFGQIFTMIMLIRRDLSKREDV